MSAAEDVDRYASGINYRDVANEAFQLISPSRAHRNIQLLLDDTQTGIDEIAKIIECDPVIAGQILRFANNRGSTDSAQVDTVLEAVETIGVEGIRKIMLAIAAKDTFDGIPEDLVEVQDFWHHSVCCGLAAQVLAERFKQLDADRLFVAGLLHDLGQLAIYHQLPDLAREVLAKAGEPEGYRYRAEKEVIGFTHCQVGAEMLRSWRLPANIWEPVEFHHEPMLASRYPLETAILHIATNVANAVEPSWKTRSDLQQAIRAIDSGVWRVTGLSEGDLEAILNEVIHVLLRRYYRCTPASRSPELNKLLLALQDFFNRIGRAEPLDSRIAG